MALARGMIASEFGASDLQGGGYRLQQYLTSEQQIKFRDHKYQVDTARRLLGKVDYIDHLLRSRGIVRAEH